jgi:hypothetical protein
MPGGQHPYSGSQLGWDVGDFDTVGVQPLGQWSTQRSPTTLADRLLGPIRQVQHLAARQQRPDVTFPCDPHLEARYQTTDRCSGELEIVLAELADVDALLGRHPSIVRRDPFMRV